jgi:hypothetical protein
VEFITSAPISDMCTCPMLVMPMIESSMNLWRRQSIVNVSLVTASCTHPAITRVGGYPW